MVLVENMGFIVLNVNDAVKLLLYMFIFHHISSLIVMNGLNLRNRNTSQGSGRKKTLDKPHFFCYYLDDAIVYLHYFKGNMDWYITEKDMIEEEQNQAFGYADLGLGFGELGYISLIELAENGVELDLHWTPKTLREVKEKK